MNFAHGTNRSGAGRRGLRRAALVLALGFAAVPGAGRAQVFESENVVLLAHRDEFEAYSDIWGFVGNDGREYVILQATTGSAWYDVEDPVHPSLVKFIPGPTSGWRDAFDIGDHVYLGTEGGGGIQIVDVSTPSDPTLVGVYNATVSNSHTVFGDRSRKLLYVLGGFADNAQGGLQVIDCSNPTNLVEVGRWTNQYVHDASAEGSVVHADLIQTGRLRLLDVSNPANPVGLGTAWADPTGATHASWPLGDGVHVLIAEETSGGHVKCLDVSNPNAIDLVSEHHPAPGTSAHNVHVQGDVAAVSWYTRGTRLLDVSDPTNLVEIGYLDTFPGSGGLFSGNWGTWPHFPSGLIASSDRSHGLFLFRYEPDAAALSGVVSSSAGGALAGATVEYTNLELTSVTGANGLYSFACFPGSGHAIRFSAYGHEPDSAVVVAVANGTTTTNVTLQKLPSGGISGTIRDAATNLPIELADVALAGSPFSTTTGPGGTYSFPDVVAGAYTLEILRYGYFVPPPIPVTVPTGAVLTRDVALDPASVYESFANGAGWTVSGDAATGIWVVAEPLGTYVNGAQLQPETDHTLDPENRCAVTGNLPSGGISDDDVDGGATRLLSPVYDLSGMTQPHVFYYRWYAQTAESDAFVVEATGDGGASWATLESTLGHEPQWTGRDFDLSGRLASYAAVQFRFTAQDFGDEQVVEAALDDFTIYDAGSGGTDVPHGSAPRFSLELAQNRPNPFATATAIRFSLASRSYVELSIFDVAGRRVAVLVDAQMDAGSHEVVWDGRDFTGARAGSGVYFTKLSTNDQIRTRKMIRLD